MLPTFSGIDTPMHCAASAALPHDRRYGEAAERGTGAHVFAAAAVTHGRATALKGVAPEYAAYCESLDLSPLLEMVKDNDAQCETALAYNPDTDVGRLLGRDIGREYRAHGANMEEEFCGSLDFLIGAPDRFIIVDLKTGRSDPHLWQLKAQAVAVSRTYQADVVETLFAKVREDGTLDMSDRHTWHAWDLDLFALELKELKNRIERDSLTLSNGGRPSLHEGPWCRWCPAFHSCPAKQQLVRALPAEVATVDGLTDIDQATGVVSVERLKASISALAPIDRGALWERIQRYQEVLQRMRDALEEDAARQPIPLPSGGMLKESTIRREFLDGEVAERVLYERFGSELVQLAIKPSCSKEGLYDALKARYGFKAATLKRETLAAIEQAGGIRVSVSTRVKPEARKRGLP